MADGIFKHGYGLFVGVGGNDIPVTRDDAKALYGFFTDPSRASYLKSNVRVLTENEATRQNILDSLDWLIQKSKNDKEATVVVYYSGHGGLFKRIFKKDEYYLVPHGYNPSKHAETAISGIEFTNKIEFIQAKKLIVLLDCCHAGGIPAVKELDSQFIKSPIPPELLKVLETGAGRIIIGSSLEQEYSLTGDPYSIFTACLLDALHGKASVANDGYARILDVLIYLFKEVPKRSDAVQHPLLKKAQELDDNFPICYYAGGHNKSISHPVDSSPQFSIGTEDILTLDQQERLKLELKGLHSEYLLRMELINRLRKAHLLEEDVLRKFKYEQNLLDLEQAVATLKVKIVEVERQLGVVGTNSQGMMED